jgi:hypothetical protein
LLDVCRIHTDSFAVETRLSALTLKDYNVEEKTFVEVDENDGVQREIKNEKLSAMLTSAPLYVIQTTFSILIIAQNNKVVDSH